LGALPGFGRVGSNLAFAGARILDIADPVPDQAADIELVVEDTGAALPLAADGGVDPGPAVGTWDTLGVECLCDRARTLAGSELAVDPSHGRRFGFLDDALTDPGDAVAIGEPAGAAPGQHAADQAAPGLLAQLGEMQFSSHAREHVRKRDRG